MARRKKKEVNKLLYLVIFLFLAFLMTYEPDVYKKLETFILGVNEEQEKVEYTIPENGNLNVYFIDVGQADSILVTNGNDSMLIDAGNNDDGKNVVKFIQDKGIQKINYLIRNTSS